MGHLYFHGSTRPRMASRRESKPAGPIVCAQTEPQVEAFFRGVFAEAGFVGMPYHPRTLLRRLPACLRRLHVHSIVEARRKIQADPKLIHSILDVILLGVTEFWRDPHVFDALNRLVIPSILSTTPTPRVWSAGCSEGQELYSVAMLLNEAGCLQESRLLGTDCRADAIERAQEGFYPDETVRSIDANRRETYFHYERGAHRIAGSLRSATQWKQANLLNAIEPGPWDLILWRNMAIYLQPDVVERIWGELCDQLQPGGYLVTGKAEHPPKHLGLERVATCVYRKGVL